jgi:hypothetical protein
MSGTIGRSSLRVEMRQPCARTPEQVYAITPAGGSPPYGMKKMPCTVWGV